MWQPSSFSVPPPGCHALTSHRCQPRLHSSPHSMGSPHRAAEHTSSQRLKHVPSHPKVDCPAHLPSMPRPILWRRHTVLPVVWRHQGERCQPAALDACIRKGAPACRQLGGITLQGGGWAVQPGHSMFRQARPGWGRLLLVQGHRCRAGKLLLAHRKQQAGICALTTPGVPTGVQLQSTAMQVSARVAGLHFLH